MSALIEALNAIRQCAEPEWLTLRQRVAFDMARARLSASSPVVLTGPPGSGKTLIAWLLHRELGLRVAPAVDSVPPCPPGGRAVIVDNADVFTASARVALAQATLHGWTTAAILGRDLNVQGIPSVRLPMPRHEEITGCLQRLPVPLAASMDATNFWRALVEGLSKAREGGERDDIRGG